MRLICALEARSHCSLFCLYLSLCSCDFCQCISIELNSHSDVQTLSSTSTTIINGICNNNNIVMIKFSTAI